MKCDNMKLLCCVLLIIVLAIIANSVLFKNKENFSETLEKELTDLQAKCYFKNNPGLLKEILVDNATWNGRIDRDREGKRAAGRQWIEKAQNHWKNHGYKEGWRASPFTCLTDYEAQCYLDALFKPSTHPIYNRQSTTWAETKKKNPDLTSDDPIERAKWHWKKYGNTEDHRLLPFTCATDPNNRNKYYVYVIPHPKAGNIENMGWPNRPKWTEDGDVSVYPQHEFNSKFVISNDNVQRDKMLKEGQFSEIVSMSIDGKVKTGRYIKDDYTIKHREFYGKKPEYLTKNNLNNHIDQVELTKKFNTELTKKLNEYMTKTELTAEFEKYMIKNDFTNLKIPLTGEGSVSCVGQIKPDGSYEKIDCPWDVN